MSRYVSVKDKFYKERYNVEDTDRATKTDEGEHIEFKTLCVCNSKEDADLISDALNNARLTIV